MKKKKEKKQRKKDRQKETKKKKKGKKNKTKQKKKNNQSNQTMNSMTGQHALGPKPQQFLSTNTAGSRKQTILLHQNISSSPALPRMIKIRESKMRVWREVNYQPVQGSGLKGETRMEE